eukprot:jgi/Undpi1/12702/HiC_scaffold_6.g02370.m1
MDVLEVKEGTETYLVAKRDLVAGEVLFDCSPGTLSSERSRYSIQVAADQHLTVCDNLDYINHGCTPNCQLELVKSPSGKDPCLRVFVAAPKIARGQTLRIDYNAMEINMISSFDCNCGAVNCRGRISGFSNLPRSVQEEYIEKRWSTSEVGDGGSGAPALLTEVVKDWVAANIRS